MSNKTLAAYTGPTPATGYVGYVNLSLIHGQVRITVRPETTDGSGPAEVTIPANAAIVLCRDVLEALGDQPHD